jgi:hypothetical protein
MDLLGETTLRAKRLGMSVTLTGDQAMIGRFMLHNKLQALLAAMKNLWPRFVSLFSSFVGGVTGIYGHQVLYYTMRATNVFEVQKEFSKSSGCNRKGCLPEFSFESHGYRLSVLIFNLAVRQAAYDAAPCFCLHD